jgi:DNA-binding protein H-NS
MDLSQLSVPELKQMQQNVKNAMEEKEKQAKDKARNDILRIAQEAGVSVKDLMGGGSLKFKADGKKAPVKFQHPDNASLKWTGRGRQPVWFKEWQESGKPIDLLNVEPTSVN